MRILSTGLTVAAVLALGACAGNTSRPTDTGSMQLPTANQSVGAVTTAPPTGSDVGSMQLPSGSGGVISRSTPSRQPDTGSMALPRQQQGNSIPR